MSDPRIALVAEGPTDLVLIEAALKAILQRSFILTLRGFADPAESPACEGQIAIAVSTARLQHH